MSWSGPAVVAAQYQQPPYANAQPGYNPQQPYQYGQQTNYNQYQAPNFPPSGPPQRPPEIRPPKKKGNPIITRYPPPPGYRGPVQPQPPFGVNQYQNQYQPPPQQYQPGYSAPQGAYQHPSYSAPPPNYPPTPSYSPQSYNPQFPQQPNYSQQGYPPAQSHQQPGYQPNQPYSQPPNYQAGQSYGQNPYPGYPQQVTPVEPTQPPYSQAQGWPQPSAAPVPPPYDPYNPQGAPAGHSQPFSQDPNATPTPISAQPTTTQSTPTVPHPSSAPTESNEKPQLFLAWDDWDFDFDGAIWPKSNEPVDPTLSLGVIIWRPAKQVTRALPSTFDDAEEQALKPPAEKLGNGESVSIYFTIENSHEAFLEVRQTDDWRKIKNDPIFVVFPDDKDMKLVPLEECLAQRDRPDDVSENQQQPEDDEMEDSCWNVMDNLEQALSGGAADAKPTIPGPPPPPSKESALSRSQTQEDILTLLGVTGTPKPPSDEIVPISILPNEEKPPNQLPEKPPVPPAAQIPPRPEQPQRAYSFDGHHNSTYAPPPQRPYGSMSSGSQHRPPPPPPPPPPADRALSWNSKNSQTQPSSHTFGASRASPAASEASNNTLAGSDFEADKPVNETDSASHAIPKLQRSDSSFSRKRSYDDGGEQNDEKLRQQDDHTRRKRRQPEVAAYRQPPIGRANSGYGSSFFINDPADWLVYTDRNWSNIINSIAEVLFRLLIGVQLKLKLVTHVVVLFISIRYARHWRSSTTGAIV
ncbi:hypothetical protein BDV96DRAFT_640746 [Lophiotrema nucula]|uniref:Uncharacterized protein n=1 Tax=Lophiotrema nucula TaxID=690887 RepID=A0A6A5ZNW3_9PLEO|nr:hypothetical protein BDV96DRAFT_640746 [Lophiotrema nucula]